MLSSEHPSGNVEWAGGKVGRNSGEKLVPELAFGHHLPVSGRGEESGVGWGRCGQGLIRENQNG